MCDIIERPLRNDDRLERFLCLLDCFHPVEDFLSKLAANNDGFRLAVLLKAERKRAVVEQRFGRIAVAVKADFSEFYVQVNLSLELNGNSRIL